MGLLTKPADVRRHRLLDVAGCAAIAQSIDALRSKWTRRGNYFYTLGAACYLDLCSPRGDKVHYSEQAAHGNAVLRQHFSDLLESLRVALEDVLSERCYFSSESALPGFHIFLAGSLNVSMRDNLHLDLQHSYLSSAVGLDAQTVTFTLPVQTPVAGAGIEICVPCDGLKRGQLVVERYCNGELLIHSGRTLHRRAHLPVTDSCRRITMQGHGLKRPDGWQLYW